MSAADETYSTEHEYYEALMWSRLFRNLTRELVAVGVQLSIRSLDAIQEARRG